MADLASIHMELLRVEEFCRQFLNAMNSARPHPYVVSALSTAAIIAYGRTIGSGVRMTIPMDVLDCIAPTHRKTHERIKILRNKWVAHSVNDMEETRLVGVLHGNHVTAVHEEHQGVLTFSIRDAKALGRLARALNKLIGAVIIEERQTFLEKLRQVAPEALAKLPRVTWERLGENPNRPRKRW